MPTRTITTKSLAILIACLTPAVAEPLSITGPARVVDGDTVVVAGTHVRLKGLDAAERGTPLGEQAKQVMEGIVGEGIVTCTLTGEHTWPREVGYCTNAAGTDHHHRNGSGAGVPALLHALRPV